MTGKTKLDAKAEAKLIALYQRGDISVTDLATRFGIKVSGLFQTLDRHGIATSRRPARQKSA